MSAPDRFPLDRFAPIASERPASFAERGVAVPFTTPILAGARLRRLPGQEPEVVLPALGGRGLYVLGWEACIGLARPTLHDRHLWERLSARPRLTPGAVRAASRATAAQGFAGRPAQVAAAAALRLLGEARGLAQEELVRMLAPQLGRPGLAGQVALLAAALAEVGAGTIPGALLAARVAAIGRLEALAAAAAQEAGDPAGRQAALLVAAAARLTQAALPAVLAPVRAMLDELPALVAEGEPAVARIALLAERPDWLLDGWEPLAAACLAAPRPARPAALRDALAQLPMPPAEQEAWCGPAPGWDAVVLGRRRLAAQPGAHAEPRMDQVLRLEQVRAAAA